MFIIRPYSATQKKDECVRYGTCLEEYSYIFTFENTLYLHCDYLGDEFVQMIRSVPADQRLAVVDDVHKLMLGYNELLNKIVLSTTNENDPQMEANKLEELNED